MREKVETKLLDNADYTIYNALSVNWKNFKLEQGYYKHFVTHDEIYKFYLIPYMYYGTTDYVDIILLLNDISSEFEMYPGTEIWIPKLPEIEEFLVKYSQGA